jgi:hypothetical protein
MLRNHAEYERKISSAKFIAISSQVSAESQLVVFADICHIEPWWMNME